MRRFLPYLSATLVLTACGEAPTDPVVPATEFEAPVAQMTPTSFDNPGYVPLPKDGASSPNGPQMAGAATSQPVPASVIVSYNGLEWVWASPCALNGCTAGILIGKDGFGFATAAQFAQRPPAAAFWNKCASPWFDLTWSHCDWSNLDGPYALYGSAPTGGLPTHNGAPMAAWGETLLVRAPVDATPPVVSYSLSGTQGDNGWFVGPVTVTWSISDPESGISSSSGCGPSTVSADGAGHTFTCSATSAGGTTTLATDAFGIDQTPPTVTYGNNAGSYDVAATVAITCAAADNLSGVASSTCADVSGGAWSFGLGTSSFSASATDNAGNSGTGATSFDVTVSYSGTCALVQAWASNAGVANSLCAKLDAASRAAGRLQTNARDGSLGAFINEVGAQSGKKIPADKAAILVALAQALMS